MKAKNAISGVFARSPFKPMQHHMVAVQACVNLIPELFDSVIAGDENRLVKTQEAVFEKEREADEIKHDIRTHLPRTVFLPVDRRDLLDILEVQDAIADTAQDIAGLLLQRTMTVPDGMQEHLKQLIRRCVDAFTQSKAIIDELDELVETGFRGPEAEHVEAMVAELNRIETETDDLAIALTRKLFEHEDEMSPISVMFWYRLIEWIGNLADNAERVGDRMLLLIAR